VRVPRLEEIQIEYKALVVKSEGSCSSEVLCVDVRIILKWMVGKSGGSVLD
jgi:hypothetical protein